VKYLIKYKLFESHNTPVDDNTTSLRLDIRDIFSEVDDMPNFDVLVSKVTKHSYGTYGLNIRIYREPFETFEENGPQIELLRDTFKRLLGYLGDKLINYEVKYSHDKDSITLPYTSYAKTGDYIFRHKNIIPGGFKILGINLSLKL